VRPEEVFTEAVAKGNINFNKASFDDLDEWGKKVVATYLMRHGLNWALGDLKEGNAYCIKVEHPEICYLDIYCDTEEFQWFGVGHKESHDPDLVSSILISEIIPDAKVTRILDDKTGISTLTVCAPSGQCVLKSERSKDGKLQVIDIGAQKKVIDIDNIELTAMTYENEQVEVMIGVHPAKRPSFKTMMCITEYMMSVVAMGSNAGFEKALELLMEGAMTYKTLMRASPPPQQDDGE